MCFFFNGILIRKCKKLWKIILNVTKQNSFLKWEEKLIKLLINYYYYILIN